MKKYNGTRTLLPVLFFFWVMLFSLVSGLCIQAQVLLSDTIPSCIHEHPLSHIPFTYELDNSTTTGSSCPNSDFSLGDFTNWIGHYGSFGNPSQTLGFFTIPPNERHLIIPAPGTTDTYGTNVAGPETLNTVFPGEAFSARLGNSATGGQAEQLSYDITIGPNSDFFIYRYAVVLNHNSDHTPGQRASFEINIIDKGTGQQYDPVCGYYYVYAQPNLPGWFTSPLTGGSNNLPVYWKDWTTVGLGFDVSDYGKTLTIVFTTKDCSPGGHFGYAYISAFCSSLSVSFQGCEGSNTVTMTGPPGFADYEWTGPYCPTCTPAVVGTTPSITITNASTGDEYRLRLVSFYNYPNCVIQKVTSTVAFTQMEAEFTYSINCIGNPSTFTDVSVINQNATDDRIWDFGDGSPPVTLTTVTATHVYATAGSYDVKLKRATTDPCQDSITHTIVVATLPPEITNTPMSKSICSGQTVSVSLNFTQPSAIATWTRTVTSGTATITNNPATQSGSLIDDLIINSTATDAVVTYTLTPKIGNCIGVPVPYVVTVHPIPTVNPIANQTYCNNISAPATLVTSPVGAGTAFAWTNTNTAIGLAASGTGDIPAFTATNPGVAPISSNITITPTANGCAGTPLTFTITVNPTPTVNLIPDQAWCNAIGVPVTPVSSPVGGGTTFTWTNTNTSIGLAANGTGNIPAFTATNGGTAPISGSVTVTPTANACIGTPLTYIVTVNPIPTINPIPGQTYCNAASAPVTTVSSPVATGTIFSWTNSNTAIGLAANGTGDIPAFTATNPGTAPITAVVTITSSANSCSGAPLSYTITVNPTATVNPIPDQTFCNSIGAPITPVSSPVGVSTTFAWTNSNTAIGLAASGIGDIPAFTATNSGIAPINAAITIIPTANACIGTPLTYSITVNPTPTVNPIGNQTFCNGVNASLTSVSSPVGAGTTFTWTNDNAAIGLPSAGTGDIPAFTATNTGIVPISATITIIPAANACIGPPLTYSITVNPTPTVDAIPNQAWCNGIGAPVTAVSSPVGAGTTFSWTNSNPGIGLAASGTGNIQAFTATNTGTTTTSATITITPEANACIGTPLAYSITVFPTPDVDPIASQVFCNNAAVPVTVVSSPVGSGTTFSWTNSNTLIGLAASGTGNVPGFTATNLGTVPVSGTITITPTANACIGTPLTYTIIVNPTPTVNLIADQTYCNGIGAPLTVISSPVGAGTTFTWVNNNTVIGLAASGTGNIPAFTATNPGTTPITSIISVTPTANACTGTSLTYNIVVNPTPHLMNSQPATICSGTTLNITLLQDVAGSTYTWNASCLPTGTVSGMTAIQSTGINTISDMLTNTGNVVSTVTYLITPHANGCAGPDAGLNVPVNPTPVISCNTGQSICSGTAFTPVILNSTVAGTDYSWSAVCQVGSINPCPVAPGIANPITAVTFFNVTDIQQTTTYSITSSFQGCPGTSATHIITINPSPTVTNWPLEQTICSGQTSALVNLTSTVAGTTFSWTASTTAPITGFSLNGTSQIPAQTLTIPPGLSGFVTYHIIPSFTGGTSCPGAPTDYKINVNPLPVPSISGLGMVCELQPGVTYSTSNISGHSYSWNISGATAILGANTSSVNLTWGAYTLSPGSLAVTETIDATGCFQTTAPYHVTILQRPVPTLTGPPAVCDASTGNMYQTETGMNNYIWTVAGGSITAGGGTGSASASVHWNIPGSQWIEVNYINAMGCPGFPSKKLPVTVYSLPNTTITEGPGPNCESTSHGYQTPPDPACSYAWTISPTGRGMVTSGQGLSNVTIDWFTSGPTTISVTATNATTSCNATGSYPLTIHPKPSPVFDVPCFDLITTPVSRKFILRGGTPFLSGQGVYTGNRVSLNTGTGNYEFDPFGASPGNYLVTYSFTNTFGCQAVTTPVSISVANNFFNCGGDLTDIRDGKKYKTAMLAGRCWMRENLNYGSLLSSPSGPVQSDNCLPEKYCSPDDVGCTNFGGMYQWDEMMDYTVTPGSKGICPPEWHVPTEAEWQSLIDNVLTGVGAPVANALAGSTLKDAIVTGSFYALLCGMDYNNNYWAFTNGSNTGTHFWTSTAYNTTHALARGLNVYTPSVSRYPGSRGNAFSLRCVKD